MYAEDIDLSYRLEKAGYINYYFAEATIVHFKGESTRRDIRYIRQFYKAMIQFRRKHFNAACPPCPVSRWRPPSGSGRRLSAIGWLPACSRSPHLQTPQHLAHRRSRRHRAPASRPGGFRHRIPAPDEQSADEIIYCIGKEFIIQISHPKPSKERTRRKPPRSMPPAAMPSSAARAAMGRERSGCYSDNSLISPFNCRRVRKNPDQHQDDQTPT